MRDPSAWTIRNEWERVLDKQSNQTLGYQRNASSKKYIIIDPKSLIHISCVFNPKKAAESALKKAKEELIAAEKVLKKAQEDVIAAEEALKKI